MNRVRFSSIGETPGPYIELVAKLLISGRIGVWENGKRYARDVLLGKNFTYGVGGGWCL